MKIISYCIFSFIAWLLFKSSRDIIMSTLLTRTLNKDQVMKGQNDVKYYFQAFSEDFHLINDCSLLFSLCSLCMFNEVNRTFWLLAEDSPCQSSSKGLENDWLTCTLSSTCLWSWAVFANSSFLKLSSKFFNSMFWFSVFLVFLETYFSIFLLVYIV